MRTASPAPAPSPTQKTSTICVYLVLVVSKVTCLLIYIFIIHITKYVELSISDINSFSPTCVKEGFDDYRCIACPEGYEGKYCERLDMWQWFFLWQVSHFCLKHLTWLHMQVTLSFYVIFPTRCAAGYHGNPQTPGGHCEECKCSLWGAWPEPCDPVTGQCRCRVGATGRSCDQCMERHVCGPTGINCKTNSQRLAVLMSYLFHFGLWVLKKGQSCMFFVFGFKAALITVFVHCLNTIDRCLK